MIIVKIFGGLGNQLFQYAFGIYAAERLGTEVVFDAQTELASKNFTTRKLALTEFFPIKFSEQKNANSFKIFSTGFFWRVERKLVQKFRAFNRKYFVQNDPHIVPLKLLDETYYEGYWQNYKITDAVRNHFLKHIKLPTESLVRCSETLLKIQSSQAVAIHIRRDDYINIPVNTKLYQICDMNYYTKAIDVVLKKIPNAVFFIFTQDKEWATANFIGEKFIFLDGNSAVEDMLLMSYCKHNIIANSTFSWWSAWLNENPEKMVIAPQKWYKTKLNETVKNLIPPAWITI